jgi:hypothetical protein
VEEECHVARLVLQGLQGVKYLGVELASSGVREGGTTVEEVERRE